MKEPQALTRSQASWFTRLWCAVFGYINGWSDRFCHWCGEDTPRRAKK